MRAFLVAAGLIGIGLAGCSKPASDAKTGEPAAQASAAATATMPQLRLGRWKQTLTVMGRPMTTYDCVTTADLNQLGHDPNSNCTSPNGFQLTAEGLVYEAQCTGEQGASTIRTVMTGDLQNSYVVNSTINAPELASAGMPAQMTMHIEGAYEGACLGDE